jgi:hypothetical protein
MFATYVDHVEDTRNISGVSRFLSGGMGGITSQLCSLSLCIVPLHRLLISNSDISHRNFEGEHENVEC